MLKKNFKKEFFFGSAVIILLIAAIVMAGNGHAFAADEKYPRKPITIVVPFSAGGSADRLARGLATFLVKELNQPVVVRNSPGAGSLVGHNYFLQQPADGYTFLLSTAHPYITNNILFMNAKFTLDDFDFINVQWKDSTGIFASNKKPWRTMKEFLDNVKANPGQRSMSTLFASSGHLAMLATLDAIGLPNNAVNFVIYEGGGDTKTAAAGGIVDTCGTQIEGAEPLKDLMTLLAVYDDERLPEYKDTPTIHEVLKEYKTDCPSITGSMRTFTAHAAFNKKYPDRHKIITAALKRTLEREDFRSWCQKQNIPYDWLGHEKSTKLIKENFEVTKKYQHLFKK